MRIDSADYCVEEVLVPSTWLWGVGVRWGSAWRDSVGVAGFGRRGAMSTKKTHMVLNCGIMCLMVIEDISFHGHVNISALRGFVRFFGSIKNE